METNREALKILVLGAGAVGKTCLTLQFVRNEFVCGYTPTIEEVYETPAEGGGEGRDPSAPAETHIRRETDE